MRKVLVARLEDGEFLLAEDQKLAIADLVENSGNVTFHEKIGSSRARSGLARLRLSWRKMQDWMLDESRLGLRAAATQV